MQDLTRASLVTAICRALSNEKCLLQEVTPQRLVDVVESAIESFTSSPLVSTKEFPGEIYVSNISLSARDKPEFEVGGKLSEFEEGDVVGVYHLQRVAKVRVKREMYMEDAR